MSTAFYLVHHGSETLIANPALGVRIQVYDLSKVDFKPSLGKMDFYGQCPHTFLAFETAYTDGRQLDAIIDALRWYVSNIQGDDMTLSLMDPRKILPLRT